MPFTIVVYGPNFINELHRHKKEKDYIMNILSFPVLQELIQHRLRFEGLHSHPFLRTEFICSDKEQIGRFSGDEKRELLDNLRRERGVTVREVRLSSDKGEEKGVDMSVFTTMLEMGTPTSDIVLVAKDKDYVPAIRELTKRGIHTVVVGFDDGKYPIELINESYLFIDLGRLLEAMEEALSLTQERVDE